MAANETEEASSRATVEQDNAHEILIAHADRCWKAECENAARIESRMKLTAGAIMALLGLGFFKVDWLYDPRHESRLHWVWVVIAMRIALVFALIFLAWALAVLFARRPNKPQVEPHTSSEQLSIKGDDVQRPVREAVFLRTYKAYTDLQARNGEQWTKLKRAEDFAIIGVVFVFAALLVYLIFSVPPK